MAMEAMLRLSELAAPGLFISYVEQPVSFNAQRLVADRLTCRRGERMLFENLSFTVGSGAGLVLTGSNGVGKTSLLRILAGLLQPLRGSARIEPAEDIPLAEQCCFIGVRDGLKGALTPREHVDFWMAMAGSDERRPSSAGGDGCAIRTLAEWGLADMAAVPAGWLSAGQRRRLALARLACGMRPVWLLDEPLNGLDAWSVDRLKRLAAGFLAAGGILVVASHQPIDWPQLRPLALVGPVAPPGAAP
jgi:heme exporter protein A